MNAAVEIVEVAPRDGLQSEEAVLPVETRVDLINRCIDAGARRIEVCSFVNPARVPQMAGAEEVLAALSELQDVTYIGLVLNERGFERAANAGVREINVVAVATDTFGVRNQGATSAETIATFEAIAARALDAGIRPTLTISTAFGCPYEGEVDAPWVTELVRRGAAAGAAEVALADTIGVASPRDVIERLTAARAVLDGAALRAHFHNTRNTGIANAYAALEVGVDALDSSLGGIGGCPFAPNATGNIPTEDLAFMLSRMGVETGLDLSKLVAIVPWIEAQLGTRAPGLLSKAGLFPRS